MASPLEMFEILQWMKDAGCKGNTKADFFPIHGQTEQSKLAYSICSRCNVKTECLNYAVERPEIMGIWGGTSHRQRRKIRMQRGISE
jgi:WhiB family redox-sensing transcriptional regulator